MEEDHLGQEPEQLRGSGIGWDGGAAAEMMGRGRADASSVLIGQEYLYIFSIGVWRVETGAGSRSERSGRMQGPYCPN